MSKSNSDAITAILTVWKRNHLEEQLQALFQQTVCPDQIWVLHSKYYVDVDAIIRKYKDRIRYMRWDDCPGVFGRFEIVTRIETPFVYIADDDIIPGKQFLERALEACKRMLAIISPHGRLISPDNKNGFTTFCNFPLCTLETGRTYNFLLLANYLAIYLLMFRNRHCRLKPEI